MFHMLVIRILQVKGLTMEDLFCYLTKNYDLEFHQITRGCLNGKTDSFTETDEQFGCWNDDFFKTENIELQVPTQYRVQNGSLASACRNMLAFKVILKPASKVSIFK